MNLFEACDKGDLEQTKKLIDHGADVNVKNHFKQTPLHLACSNYNLVEYLIAHGAKVNSRDKNYCTPLHLACAYGSRKLIKLLIDVGANINAKIKPDGFTPLDVALVERDKTIIKLLIDHRAKVGIDTSLFIAMKRNNLDIFKLVFSKLPLSQQEQFKNTTTLIDMALKAVSTNIIPFLIREGFKLNI